MLFQQGLLQEPPQIQGALHRRRWGWQDRFWEEKSFQQLKLDNIKEY